MTRAEVLEMVVFQCEDNYGEELTPRSVKDNWDSLVESLQSEGELPKNFAPITKSEIKQIMKKVDF